jgi:hypothetical protein
MKKKYTAEFIIEIHNIFISYGTNNKLIIYSDSYEKISSVETEDWIYNILDYDMKFKITRPFIACSKKEIYVYSKITNKSYHISERLKENNLVNLLYEDSYYFSCCENNVLIYYSLFDKLGSKFFLLIYKNILMKSAIKINNKLLVFKSNKIVSKGMSQLFLYNYRVKCDIPDFIKKGKEDKEEYSFVYSPLGQALIIHKSNDVKKDTENRILLFACKKKY